MGTFSKQRVTSVEVFDGDRWFVDVRFRWPSGEMVHATFGNPVWTHPPTGPGSRRGDQRRKKPRLVSVGHASTGTFAVVEILTPEGNQALGTFRLSGWLFSPREFRDRVNRAFLSLRSVRLPRGRAAARGPRATQPEPRP